MVRHLTLLCLLFPGLPARSETVEHAGTRYWVHRIDPKTARLELHLSAGAGIPNTFPNAAERVQASGRRLVFAMNSGIFEGNFLPTGLHISEGKTVVPLNRESFTKRLPDDVTPNFYLKPNGVFYLRADGTAAVAETERYATLEETPVLATQSGPLLVEKDRIHPELRAESTSRRFRNGIGVTADGRVVMACSVLDPAVGRTNLYRFAELFRDRLGCPDVLYLDGDISYVYLRDETGPIEMTNHFAGILVVTEPLP